MNNPLMAPMQGAMPTPQPAQGMGPPQQPMAPQQAPAPTAAAPQPTRNEIEQAHQHTAVMIHGLMDLTNKPQGQLTKQDVFKTAADMIAKGAFPTPESKQQLVVEMAKMPDDEQGIRKALGQFLLGAASNQTKLHAAFGPPGGQPLGS